MSLFTTVLINLLVVSINAQEMKKRMIPQSFPGRCQRAPPGVVASDGSGSNGFSIKISGNPKKYQPGELYTVTLQGYRSPLTTQTFIGFMLLAEPKEGRNDMSTRHNVGTFQLLQDALSKFSEDCPNAIVDASPVEKSEIQVMWKAPPAGSGCIIFKATIQESKEKWYSEDGNLIQQLCEEEQMNQDQQPEILEECCACDEVKYEFTYENLWSRNTHPKAFPSDKWRAKISEIIGASHSNDFRIWEYGGLASDGLKDLVLSKGSTQKLEAEFKPMSDKIRTIIKARGLWPPQMNEKTFAIFRMDKRHHLLSFLTKLSPSPDWIVGISALELCLKNCSWVNEKVMNLYLWDTGIDSTLTFSEDPRPSTVPREKIRLITSSNPNTEISPFYDPTGTPMKPLARLIVSRKRVYEKPCDDYDPFLSTPALHPTDMYGNRLECQVTEWTEWTPCSSTCGRGKQMRTRQYFNQLMAEKASCKVQLLEDMNCTTLCVGPVSCRASDWSEWSECSVTCGKGHRTRDRKYEDPRARKTCGLGTTEKQTCLGVKPICDTVEQLDNPQCGVTKWSEWSPCNASCGKSRKVRTRLYLNPNSYSMCNVERTQYEMCNLADCVPDTVEAEKICKLAKDPGACRGYFPRWYYDVSRSSCMNFIYGGCRGNRNNFERYSECASKCHNVVFQDTNEPVTSMDTAPSFSTPVTLAMDFPQPIDCEVSEWSEWSSCSTTCDDGRKERKRSITQKEKNGGAPCPKLKQKRRCRENEPCSK